MTLGVLWGTFGLTLGYMTVALGHFLDAFDVENVVDVYEWWLGGLENQNC